MRAQSPVKHARATSQTTHTHIDTHTHTRVTYPTTYYTHNTDAQRIHKTRTNTQHTYSLCKRRTVNLSREPVTAIKGREQVPRAGLARR